MGKFSWKMKSGGRRRIKEDAKKDDLQKINDGENDVFGGGREFLPEQNDSGKDIKETSKISLLPNDSQQMAPKNSAGGNSDTEDGEIRENEDEDILNMSEGEGNGEAVEVLSPLRRSKRKSSRSEDDIHGQNLIPNRGSHYSSANTKPSLESDNLVLAPSAKRLQTLASNMHQCRICGKVYKHRNCLSKHAWEHHEGWTLTKRWCQTKHQQVQMLEAAQVLTEMTGGETIEGLDLVHMETNGARSDKIQVR